MSWAQPDELGATVRDLLPHDTWCAILAIATDVLWAATGRRWRNISLTETVSFDPLGCCNLSLARHFGGGVYLPPLWPHTSRYDCGVSRVRLPRDDVTAITAVTLNGSAFTAWRLGGNWLVRTDGFSWPLSNTTRITYTYGRTPPVGGRMAVLTLAAETGKWWAGQSSALPARVTNVTRQGISFTVLDDLQFLRDGLTGIPAVDAWVLSVNPGGVRQQASVWSPDLDAVTARRA